jgi:hypothetical protein
VRRLAAAGASLAAALCFLSLLHLVVGPAVPGARVQETPPLADEVRAAGETKVAASPTAEPKPAEPQGAEPKGVEAPAADPAPAGAAAAGANVAEPTAAGPVAESLEVPEETGVRYERGHLTASADDMSLTTFLREVGRQSGAHVRFEGLADRQVSLSFERLPLDEALRRVLVQENFTLIYAEERGPQGQVVTTRLKELQVYGGRPADGAPPHPARPPQQAATAAGPPPATAAAAPTGTTAAMPANLLGEFSQLFAKHESIPLTEGSHLAEALGAENASFEELLDTAMRADEAVVRTEAAQAIEGVFDTDAEMRQALTRSAGSVDAGAIASMLRASGSEHAEEMLRHMASNLKTAELRFKANEILLRLRRPVEQKQ